MENEIVHYQIIKEKWAIFQRANNEWILFEKAALSIYNPMFIFTLNSKTLKEAVSEASELIESGNFNLRQLAWKMK